MTKKNLTKDSGLRLTEEEEKQIKDAQTLALQVEALQAQLEEQTKLAKEQVHFLLHGFLRQIAYLNLHCSSGPKYKRSFIGIYADFLLIYDINFGFLMYAKYNISCSVIF